MSVKAQNTTTTNKITRKAPTLGSKTQKRKAGFAAQKRQHKRRSKGGGLNSHWNGFIDAKARSGEPGADKKLGGA